MLFISGRWGALLLMQLHAYSSKLKQRVSELDNYMYVLFIILATTKWTSTVYHLLTVAGPHSTASVFRASRGIPISPARISPRRIPASTALWTAAPIQLTSAVLSPLRRAVPSHEHSAPACLKWARWVPDWLKVWSVSDDFTIWTILRQKEMGILFIWYTMSKSFNKFCGAI